MKTACDNTFTELITSFRYFDIINFKDRKESIDVYMKCIQSLAETDKAAATALEQSGAGFQVLEIAKNGITKSKECLETTMGDIIRSLTKLTKLAADTEDPELVQQSKTVSATLSSTTGAASFRASLVTSLLNAPILKFEGTSDDFVNDDTSSNLHSFLVTQDGLDAEYPHLFDIELRNKKRALNKLPMLPCEHTVTGMYTMILLGKRKPVYRGVISTNLLTKATLDIIRLYKLSKCKHYVAQLYNQVLNGVVRTLIYELLINHSGTCTTYMLERRTKNQTGYFPTTDFPEAVTMFDNLKELFDLSLSNMEITPQCAIEISDHGGISMDSMGAENLMSQLSSAKNSEQAKNIMKMASAVPGITNFLKSVGME